jgi:hypothetical protein
MSGNELRDNRTLRFIERMTGGSPRVARLPVDLTVDQSLTSSFLTDLVSRFSSELKISGDGAAVRRARSLADRLGIHPTTDKDEPTESSVSSGDQSIRFFPRTVSWSAGVWPAPGRQLEHPVGALAAASLSAADAFRPLLRLEKESWWGLSTWTYHRQAVARRTGPPSVEADLGHVVVVGVGAVASAMLACLEQFRLRGSIDLVDPDVVDETNLNRYVGLGEKDVGRSKVTTWARRLAAHDGLQVRVFPWTYSDYRSRERPPYPLVIVSTDNPRSRQEVQGDLPKVIINAATDGPRLTVSTHRFGHGACLGCLYPFDEGVSQRHFHQEVADATGIAVQEVRRLFEEYAPITMTHVRTISARIGIPAERLRPALGHPFPAFWAQELCGMVQLPEEERPEGTAPFVSALAGALTAGEVLKATQHATRLPPNYFLMNIFSGPTKFSRQRMGRASDCSAACYDAGLRRQYRRLWPD